MKANPRYTSSHSDMMSDLFHQWERHWKGGMDCPGYSSQEQEAFEIATTIAIAQGQDVYEDAAGNRIFLWPGIDPDLPVVLGGSHLDAVPQGGRYDGRAGVAARLAATQMLYDVGFIPTRGFGTIVFRNEESPWFGDYAVGSKLATCQLAPSFLDQKRKDTGHTLAWHMQDIGLNPDRLAALITANQLALPVRSIHHFHEVHIEQGPLLARAGMDLGIVSGIRGNVRFTNDAKLVFHGVAGHSGAVPFEDRVDAVAIGAEAITAMRGQVARWNRQKRDAVITFPIAKTHEKASPTTIPDYFESQIEVRSIDEDILVKARAMILERAKRAAKRHGGRMDVDAAKIVFNKPALMNEALTDEMLRLATAMKYKAMRMASGAGHDAAIMAWAGVDSAMTFLAHGNKGASHRPDEIMGLNANDNPVAVGSSFAKAAQLDARLIVQHCSFGACMGAARGQNFVDALLRHGGRVIHKSPVRYTSNESVRPAI